MKNSKREGIVLDAEPPEQTEGLLSRIKTLKKKLEEANSFGPKTKKREREEKIISNIFPKLVRGLKRGFWITF